MAYAVISRAGFWEQMVPRGAYNGFRAVVTARRAVLDDSGLSGEPATCKQLHAHFRESSRYQQQNIQHIVEPIADLFPFT